MWDENAANSLSRRERQVVDIVLKHGRCTGRQIEEELPDAPTYSAVRSILRLLVEKEVLVKTLEDGRDLFTLPVAPAKARVKALHSVVERWFDSSFGDAAMALLGNRKTKISAEEAERLIAAIRQATDRS
jgi:predicted transcriptional regulator